MNINWVPIKKINNNRVIELLKSSIETNQFTNGGPNVALLENIIRKKLIIDDSKAVIGVNNGTAAIHALVSGIHLYHNQKIQWATQSFTFPASAQATLEDAHIIDIDEGGGLDLEQVPNDTKGIIVTNIFGNVVDIDKYVNWANENNKFLIFDNAATAFTFYKGKNSCNYGTGSTISFHHTKPIGFGEGGAIIVDKKYEESIRRIMNFGIHNEKKLPWNRLGSNYKMSDIQAVYIIQYLDHFEKIVKHHKMLYQELKKGTNVKMYPNFSDGIPFLSCFCLLDNKFDNEFIQKVLDKGIYCRKYYHPLKNTPVACKLYDKIICLPCTIDMDSKEINIYLEYIHLNYYLPI